MPVLFYKRNDKLDVFLYTKVILCKRVGKRENGFDNRSFPRDRRTDSKNLCNDGMGSCSELQ